MSDDTASTNQVTVLSDAPAERDMLDYGVYRDTLVSIIDGPNTETPLTIGVYGEWGSGKTTLLNMVEEKLDKLHAETVWVDVWQFESQEDIWAAFLQALLLKVKTQMPWHKRLLFNAGLLTRRTDWQRLARKILELLVRIGVVVVPLYIFSSGLISSVQSLQTPSEIVVKGAGTLASAVLGWYLLLQPYIQAVRERVQVDLTNIIETSPLSERVSVLEQFETYFEDMIVSFVGEKGRVVVFVDDLDRCSSEQVTQVLDAIKVFLEIPRCIYVLGLDREVVEQAVTTKFAEFEERAAQAHEYLDKIIGLPFYLPRLSAQQMQAFVRGLGASFPDEDLTQVFALGQAPNPRKVKRAINMFLFVWALAQRRETLKGIIQSTRLAKIVVIQHSYRDLYGKLDLFPQLLGELEAYFRRLEDESSPAKDPPVDGETGVEETSFDHPDYLRPFTTNRNLRKLLTLHPGRDVQSKDANFTVWEDGEYKPIAEENIRSYIELTYSVAPEQRRVRRTRSTGEVAFVNREAELEFFRQTLEDDSTEARILLLTAPGGWGKTALLKQYKKMCAERSIPAALLDMSQEVAPLQLIEHIRTELHTYHSFDEYVRTERARQGSLDHLKPDVSRDTGSIVHEISEFSSEVPNAEYAHYKREEVEQAFMKDLNNLTSSTKVVLLIDSWERALPEIQAWFMARFVTAESRRTLPHLLIVMAGRELPDIPSAMHISPSPLSPTDIEELISSYGYDIELSDEDLQLLTERMRRGDNLKSILELVALFADKQPQ